jgi:hypothetical protein
VPPSRRVGGEPWAPHAVEGFACELGHPVDGRLAQAPKGRGPLRAETLAGEVVGERRTAQSEAAVSPTRAAGHLARLVHADTQATFSEPQGARATGQPGSDDGHIDATTQLADGEGRRFLLEPERSLDLAGC